MASNHNNDHLVRKRLLVLAFAAVVAGIPIDVWRSGAERGSWRLGPRDAASQQSSLRDDSGSRLAGVQGPRDYYWLRQIDVADELPKLSTSEVLALEIRNSLDQRNEVLPILSQSQPLDPGITVVDLVPTVPDDDTAYLCDLSIEELLAEDVVKRSRVSPDAWKILGYDTTQFWRRAGILIAGGRPELYAKNERRIASPMSLVQRPLVESESDRLALVPPQRYVLPRKPEPTDWTGVIYKTLQPGLASRIDRQALAPRLPEPTSLIVLLNELRCESELTIWVDETLDVIDRLSGPTPPVDVDIQRELSHLAALSQDAHILARDLSRPGLATKVRRARFAIWRRVETWKAAAMYLSPPVGRLALARANGLGDRSAVRLDKPVDLHADRERINSLLSAIERYESDQPVSDAIRIARAISPPDAEQDARSELLSQSLEESYRNANARVAISKEMLDRLLPQGETKTAPVRDRILGNPVSGRSTTVLQNQIQLIPDVEAWRLVLQVEGHARSNTAANRNGVQVSTIGDTRFVANQQLVLDDRGLRSGPARANVNSQSRFLAATSKFDRLPLVGGFIRSKARDEYYASRGRARLQIESKAENRAKEQIEAKVAAETAKMQEKIDTQLLKPLADVGIGVTPLEWKTTENRLVTRVRIARGDELSAHTPRPRAPSDSLASVQIHESGLSRLMAALQLDGKTLSGDELKRRFQRQATEDAEAAEDASEVEIAFTDQDAVTFALEDGRLHVIVGISKITVRESGVNDVVLHNYYRLESNGLGVRMRHDEGPFFEGKIRNSQRIRLYTALSKSMSQDRVLLDGQKLSNDRRFQGLMITQLVIDDGWLAFALGPELPSRTAQRDRYAPLY